MRRGIVLFLLVLPLGFAGPQELANRPIHGIVCADDTGAPARGAKVSLTDYSSGMRRRGGVATTDEHGAFTFPGLKAGHYTLYIEKAGFLSESVMDTAPGNEIVVRLRRVATVSGRVMDSDGEVIGNALVEVMVKSYMYGELSLHGASSAFIRTDDRGLYRISGLAPGRYYVRASSDGYERLLYPAASGLNGAQTIDLTAGDERRGVDFLLHRTRRFMLSGRLIDAETAGPARAAFLRAYSADPVNGGFADGFVHEGQFQIRDMDPGRYFLKFSWVGATNDVRRSVILPFEMGNADQTDVVLTVMPRVTVSGHLKTTGKAVPNSLTVNLLPADVAINAHAGGNGASANVKEDGTFEMTGVEAGAYRLGIHSGVSPLFFVRGRSLTVDGRASITDVEVELDFSAGTVSGKALDAGGKPIPRATVVLQTIHGEKRADGLYRHVYGTGPGGEYTIPGVVPGEYLLFVWRGDSGLIGDPELFAEAIERADRVKVDAGAMIYQNASEMRKSRNQQEKQKGAEKIAAP